ncbi:MAG: sugar isomerase [Thaumarchaeota archaeon]|nr:sugar isomerase [Nitrososphaerota archaeon]
MRTIEAFEKEIALQLGFLQKFVPQKRLSEEKQRKAIFCGTGDSFASSQLAEVFSNFRAQSHDPLDLVKNKQVFARHDIYLISISGNTTSNIELARLHKRTVAITANKNSRLAKACEDIILLEFPSTGIQTAGSISFLASALACISLVSEYQVRNVSRIYRNAVRAAKSISLGGKTYILGNMHTMPIAMFCAAKLYEVLGTDAHYERIEQFSHMGLFSAKRGDTVILFEPKNVHNENLVSNIKGCGLVPKRMDPKTKNIQEQILFFIFVSELIALYAAKKKKKRDCFFIEENELRNASSSMIY